MCYFFENWAKSTEAKSKQIGRIQISSLNLSSKNQNKMKSTMAEKFCDFALLLRRHESMYD